MPDARHVYLLTDPAQKARLRKLLMERGLASYMNDTKWRELCWGIGELAFAPAYQIKCVDRDTPEPSELAYAPAYLGDWARTPEACLGIHVEWLKIAPRYARHGGARATPAIEDCTSALLALLDRLKIVYDEQDGFITLYGHR